MLYSLLPILSFDKLSEAASSEAGKWLFGYAVQLNSATDNKEMLQFYSTKHKHCFFLADGVDIKPNTILPFFFNPYYIKFQDKPLLLINRKEENKKEEQEIISSFNKIVTEQGFQGIEIEFIYNSIPDNFSKNVATAYYFSEPCNFGQFTNAFLAGKLIGRFLLVKYENAAQLAKLCSKLGAIIEDVLNKSPEMKILFQSYGKLVEQNEILSGQNKLLQEQLTNYQYFFTKTKQSFNDNVEWYKAEMGKINSWSTDEIKRLKEWHKTLYEDLPEWYKKLGLRIMKHSSKNKPGK